MLTPPNYIHGLLPFLKISLTKSSVIQKSTLFFIHHKCASTYFNRLFSTTYGLPLAKNVKYCNYSSVISAFGRFIDFSKYYIDDEVFFEKKIFIAI